MYDFMNKNKGAVSIFLVIVLVPMMVVSSIFVDMSRVQLAKSVATSAGDLTLNTALTNYDAILKDMYGLFATSQNTDELFQNLEDYYLKCIESAGIPEPEAENYVDQIMGLLRSESGSDDLLNMNLTSFEVTKPTAGHLGNPAIMKSQIVDFMKYRAPINMGLGILDGIKSFKNLKAQNAVVEDKNAFYDSRTDVMESLEKAWSYIEDYQYRYNSQTYEGDTNVFPGGKYLENQVSGLTAKSDDLKGQMDNLAKYVYFADSNFTKLTDGIGATYDAGDTANKFDDKWTVTLSAKKEFTISDYEDSEVITDRVLELTQNAYKAVLAYEKTQVDTNELYSMMSTASNTASDSKKIYTISLFNKSLNDSSSYTKKFEAMVDALVELYGAKLACKEDISKVYIVKNDDNTIEISQNKTNLTLKSFADSQLTHLYKTKKDKTLERSEDLVVFNSYANNLSNYYSDNLKTTVDTAKKDLSNAFKGARDAIKGFDTMLTGRISCLTEAIKILDGVKTSVTDTNGAYYKALQEWEKSANAISSESMGKNDLSEIERLKKVLTADKINTLIKRLTDAKTSLENIQTQLDSYKVLNKKWLDLPDGDIGRGTIVGYLSANQKNSILSSMKSNDFSSIISSLKGTVLVGSPVITWSSQDSNPDLTKNQRELYTWLYNNFYNSANAKTKYGTNSATTATTNMTDAEKNANTQQDNIDSYASTYNNKTPNSSTESKRTLDSYKYKDEEGKNTYYLPSYEWDETLGAALAENKTTGSDSDTQLNGSTDEGYTLSLLDGIIGAVENASTTLRDDLYIANYIMNMFSYSTFENEISVENGVNASAFSSWYTYNSETKKYDESSFLTGLSSDQKTKLLKEAENLTNNSINPNMNYLYGKEVEYIIYGGTNATTSSYGTIYMIRFALNTVYAFMDAEINNTTLAAATAIFGTPPLTPMIPVAKIAMTIALALAESAYDLYELKSGNSVPLMKTADTWVMRASGLVKKVAGEVVEDLAEKAIDKGVEVLNDVIDMTDEELTAYINSNQDALTELANSTVEKTITQLENYANEAVQAVIDSCTNVNLLNQELQKANQMTRDERIAAVTSELNTWLGKQDKAAGDNVYEVKKMAVDYLTKNNGEAIGLILDAIESKGSTVAGTSTKVEGISTILESIKQDIRNGVIGIIEKAGDTVQELKDKAMTELKDAANEGAEKLRSTLKSKISSTFGNSSSKETGTTNVVSSLLSWSYSDYLQVFLLIGLIGNPEAILLRTADVIELNMQLLNEQVGTIETTTTKEVSRLWGLIKYQKEVKEVTPNPAAFKLSNSYTYLNVKATIEVKPLLMTLPLIAPSVKSQETGNNWYQVVYEGTIGY